MSQRTHHSLRIAEVLRRLSDIPPGIVSIADPDQFLIDRATHAYDGDNAVSWEQQSEGGIGQPHLELIYDIVLRGALRKGARLLDVGCGSGPLALELAGNVGPEGEVHGIDISKDLIEMARAKAVEHELPNVHFHHGSAGNALPFADGTFDVVLSHLALDLVPNKERSASELLRVLKPGGLAALVMNCEAEWSGLVNAPEAWALIFDFARKNAHAAGRIFYPRGVLPTRASMETLLTDAGFVDVDCMEQAVTVPGVMPNPAFWTVWIDAALLPEVAAYVRAEAPAVLGAPVRQTQFRLHAFARKPD